MTTIYNVGPDEMYESGCEGLVWVVAWYEQGSYEGSGEAISFDGEKYREHGLSHCSCYGTEDGMSDRSNVIDIQDVIGENVINQPCRTEIVKKVREVMDYAFEVEPDEPVKPVLTLAEYIVQYCENESEALGNFTVKYDAETIGHAIKEWNKRNG